MPLVLQTAHQRAHVAGTCLHGHIGLLKCVHEVHIHQQVFVAQELTSPYSFKRNRNFEYRLFRIKPEFELTVGLFHHFLCGVSQCFNLKYRHHFAELHDE